MSDLRTVPLELIDRPVQSIRQHIPEELIDELATSITALGLIEPLVCEAVDGRFRIIAGDRRYLACKRAGLSEVPIIVRDTSAIGVEAVQLQENLIRQDMNAAEEARLCRRLYDECGQDLEAVAGKLHMSVGYVNNRLALLEGDPLVLEAIDREDISFGVGQVLNTITRADYRASCLDLAIRSGATINLAKRWAAEHNRLATLQEGGPPPAAPAPAAAPYVPVAETVSCWFCEGTQDLDKLRMLQIHEHCIGAMDALLKKIGRAQ